MRYRSEVTMPGYRKGVPSKNKGKTFRAEILTHEEIAAMNEMCNVGVSGLRHRGMLGMMLGSGCRVGELCGLKVSDINLETRAVHIPGTKTKRADRWVGVNPVCFAPVRDWLDIRAKYELPGPYAFCCVSVNERGNQMKGAQVRQTVVLSGYPCPEADELGWRCVSLQHNRTVQARAGGTLAPAPECIWINERVPEPVPALFDGAAA